VLVSEPRADVDVTLIEALLEMTPEERILQNDRTLAMIQELRDGLARASQPARDTRSK
jgi:hypothetical protein